MGDGIYGYIVEAKKTISLAAISSEEALNAEEDDFDRDSDAASPVVPTVLLGSMEGQYAQHGHSTIATIQYESNK